MSRSGGTLLNNLCDGHPQLNVFPFEYWNLCNKNTIREFHHRFFRFLPRDRKMREVGFHQRLNDIIDGVHGTGTYDALYALFIEEIGGIRSIPDFYDVFQEFYFPRICGHSLRDKTVNHPANLSLRSPAYIQRIFGDVNLIITVRDPRASFLSYTRNRERFRGYGHNEAQTREYCKHWLEVVRLYVESDPGINSLWLRFEDVVNETPTAMHRVAEFLDVDFNETMLAPSRLGKPVESNSSFETTPALTRAPLERWQDHLDSGRRKIIETELGGQMESLGYVV